MDPPVYDGRDQLGQPPAISSGSGPALEKVRNDPKSKQGRYKET